VRARIAILGIKHLPASAGADRVVEQLLGHLSDRHHYTVYLARNTDSPVACDARASYVHVPALRGKYLRAPSYFLLCCVHYLLLGRYDLVHVHNSDFGLFCPLLKLKRRTPIVGTFHGDPALRAKWNRLAKAMLRISEAIFVRCCDALTSVSVEKRVRGRMVEHIPNGIGSAPAPLDVGGASLLSTVGLRDREFVMFACGRLDRTKGLHHLLVAYRDIPSAPRLLVVGDFSHDAGYSNAVESAAADDERVILHPALLDERSLVDVISRCSVFVFPSEVEGMSMMLLEAIAAGALVVCSDIAANLAVVGDDYPHVFRSRDTGGLRIALEEALGRADCSPETQRLRETVAREFRWDRIADAYDTVYMACLAGR
jgi:glycosyltransferase involved in cell wall biosynthesis